MKQIIERNLPLTQCYNLIETKYIPLIEGIGCTCDNCGKLIANIATVRGEENNTVYNIGFDCLDTMLLNNQILRGEDLDNYNAAKKSVPKVKKIKEFFQEFITNNPFTKKVEIEKQWGTWLYYAFFNEYGKQFWNDGTKIKEDLHAPTLLASLKSIKNVEFIYSEK